MGLGDTSCIVVVIQNQVPFFIRCQDKHNASLILVVTLRGEFHLRPGTMIQVERVYY